MKASALILALLCGAAHAADIDWASAQVVVVQMIDDQFIPDKLSFKRGVPYRLQIENRGKDNHEFTAPEFLKTLEIANPEVLESAGNEVLVKPGYRKELLFVPRKAGRYELDCADHDWDNMVGEITVEP